MIAGRGPERGGYYGDGGAAGPDVQARESLLTIQVDVVRSMALFTRIFAYFDMEPEIQNAPDALLPEAIHGTVEFRNVDFAYEPERPSLKHQLPAGARP